MVQVYGFTIISVLSGIFHIGIFAYAIKSIKRNKILSFGILFYLVSISMFLNLVIPSVGIVAERYAFTAVLGFSIILVYFVFKILNVKDNKIIYTKKSIYTISFVAILIVSYSFKTISRNSKWYDEETLYSNDIKYLNNSAKGNEIYATKLLKDIEENNLKFSNINEIKNIEQYYLRTIEIDSTYSVALKRLGFVSMIASGVAIMRNYELLC
jgi:hypothetical protein